MNNGSRYSTGRAIRPAVLWSLALVPTGPLLKSRHSLDPSLRDVWAKYSANCGRYPSGFRTRRHRESFEHAASFRRYARKRLGPRLGQLRIISNRGRRREQESGVHAPRSVLG